MSLAISAKVIADSTGNGGIRLTTLQLCYPRFIHAELMTHRVFSRNASSSRAIPVKKMIAQVWNDPAMPLHWGANQSGMQARNEISGWRRAVVRGAWRLAAKLAASVAWLMDKCGAHKQVANRILEPFQWMHTIVTATEWDNFFALRRHADAEPNFQQLAKCCWEAMAGSETTWRPEGDWHLPFIFDIERALLDVQYLLQISTARCARVSYLNHDGSRPDIFKDLELYEKLAGGDPIHASPSEHQATPGDQNALWGNFRGWQQHRKYIEQGRALT